MNPQASSSEPTVMFNPDWVTSSSSGDEKRCARDNRMLSERTLLSRWVGFSRCASLQRGR